MENPEGAATPQCTPSGRPKRHPCPYDCKDKLTGEVRHFASRHNVDQHVREQHTGERPYRCVICEEKAYARPFGLNRHMAAKHGIMLGPRQSNVCKRQQQDPRTKTSSPSTATHAPDTDREDKQSAQMGGRESSIGTDMAQPQKLDHNTSCVICKAVFNNGEVLFAHLHHVHGMML